MTSCSMPGVRSSVPGPAPGFVQPHARRVTVTFDENFHTCTVDIVYGKERGAPGFITHGMNTGLFIAQTDVSSRQCKIINGSMFGDKAE
jgi:hypothetical protein